MIEWGSLLLMGGEYIQDAIRILVHSRSSPFVPRARKTGYNSVILAHTVEKGLSLPAPRILFGRANVQEVAESLGTCARATDPLPAAMSLGALRAYLDFHAHSGCADPFLDDVADACTRVQAGNSLTPTGGVRAVTDVWNSIADRSLSYADFLVSRFSCRNFSDAPVESKTVERIVQVAQAAPSQCNRQATMVHYYATPERIQGLLSLQGGAKGFAHVVRHLFVVTNDQSAWSGARERSQCYVDGSLFAMTLLLSLHAHGLAACPLNLAVTNHRERQIRRAGNIPDTQRLVMMIAFGHPPSDGYVAARSPRRQLGHVLVQHR
jgi:nitroreductase